MRALLIIALWLPLTAQQPEKPPDKPAEKTVATTPDKPVVSTPDKPAESPVPTTEPSLTGSVDVGYRWRTDVLGSLPAYRSIVNLGSGPKLIGADFTLADPQHRAFDRIHVRASSWGDDPYSTFHVDARKSGLYEFNADYRDFAYFNFLPSYADPLLSRGIVLDEQSFDTRRRFGSFSLDLFPGHWIVPYLAYDRDSESGTGVTTFVANSNEYPVPSRLRNLTNLYRGGVRFELKRFHATLEEGGTTFKDDQSVYQSGGSPNPGNVTAPVLGQTLDLASLLATYGIRGTSLYSKGLFTASPAAWIDVYGQLLYSRPDSTVNYQQNDTGKFLSQTTLLLFNSEQFLLSAAAKLPHTTASLGAEIRPLPRLRIMESWLTDRLHATSAAGILASSLNTNYSQQQTDAFFDAPWHLTLRGGYRYVWGDANDAVLPPEGLASSARGHLRRNVGIAGATFRPSQKLSLTGELEVATSTGVYFQTSLYNYQKLRVQARYQITGSLSASADFTLLKNENPLPDIHYDYQASQESLSLFWSPAGGKRWDVEGTYSRSSFRSDIGFLEPETLQSQTSRYRENAHIATGVWNLNLLHAAKLMAGGSFFISSGSRPTSYYQPLAKLWIPLNKHVNWFTEWRYYGYGEAFYLYEGFHTHLVTTGLRFTR